MNNQKLFSVLIWFIVINISVQISVFGKDKWTRIKTDNFTLIGNAKEDQIKKVAIKIEQFREAMRRIAPEIYKDSAIDIKVIVFKDNDSFYPFKPENSKGEITNWVTGFFQSGIDTNYIALSLGKDDKQTFQTIFHEYVHYLIDNNLGRINIPTWYNEGIAEYYDQFRVKNDRTIEIGNTNQSHLKTLKERKMMSLEKFFEMDYAKLRSEDQFSASHFYAQSWAFMYYLKHFDNGKRLQQLESFLDALLKKVEIKEAFENAFNISLEQMETEFETFINADQIRSKQRKFNEPLTAELKPKMEEISVAEAYANLGDLLNLRGKLIPAENYLKQALLLEPDSSLANSSLGLLKMKQNEFANAEKYFERSIEKNSNDYLIHYRYAYFLSRNDSQLNTITSPYSDEKTIKMKALLNRSLYLNPRFPENYRLLGFINLVRNENLQEGIEYLKKALSISPNNQTYLLSLADLFYRNKEYDRSKSLAESVLQNSDQIQFRNHADDLLYKIKITLEQIEKKKIASQKDFSKSEESQSATTRRNSRETTEEDLERNRRKTLNESITEVLRQPLVGEKRSVGYISAIKCVQGKVIYAVRINEDSTQLQSDGFRKLFLRAFTKEMSNFSIDCNVIKEDTIAVLTYKPFESKVGNNLLGELVAIEFVPDDFVLTSNE